MVKFSVYLNRRVFVTLLLTPLYLASHEKDIGKQCRPKSDVTERGVWSGCTMFAFNEWISIKHGNNKNNQTPCVVDMDQSKELR